MGGQKDNTLDGEATEVATRQNSTINYLFLVVVVLCSYELVSKEKLIDFYVSSTKYLPSSRDGFNPVSRSQIWLVPHIKHLPSSVINTNITCNIQNEQQSVTAKLTEDREQAN